MGRCAMTQSCHWGALEPTLGGARKKTRWCGLGRVLLSALVWIWRRGGRFEIPRQYQEWSDEDEDIDSATSLALEQILQMKEHPPGDLGDFCARWARGAAVVNLGCKTFSRQRCHYRWCLEDSRAMFDQLADLLEFVD